LWNVILQFLAALGVLIALLWVIYAIINGKFLRNLPGGTIAVLERKYIDRNSSIVLVRLMEDYYYILITQNGGTILKKLDDIESSKLSIKETTTKDFKKIFYNKFGRKH